MHGLITQTKLSQHIKAGYGLGRDERYRSWIRIRRKLSSPVSNLHSLCVPTHERALQLLSGLEYSAATVACWLGASEIREQNPAWPEPHQHPSTGRHPDLDRKFPPVRGLLEIAKEAGIDHGVYPGTRIPFVATIDFTLTVGPWHDSRLVQWSCKPRELLDSAPNRQRMAERIAMESLYSREVGSLHRVIDGTQFPKLLVPNLNWLQPLRDEATTLLCHDRLQDFGRALMQDHLSRSLQGTTLIAAQRTRVAAHQAHAYFRAAAWYGHIDIDLSSHIVMSRPLKRDTAGVKARLQTEFLGGKP